MTLANTQIYEIYTAVAAQTQFVYNFKVFSDSDEELDVFVDGVEALTSAYTVTGVGSPTGGLINFLAPMVGGEQVFIIARMEADQDFHYNPGGSFPATSHEDIVDRLTRMLQITELQDRLSLRVGIPALTAVPPITTVVPEPTEGALAFVPDGGGMGGGSFAWVEIPDGVTGSLPSQSPATNGLVLSSNGMSALWSTLAALLGVSAPTTGQHLTNDGVVTSWVDPPVAVPALPAPPAAGVFPVLRTDGATAFWLELFPALEADMRLASNAGETAFEWVDLEVPVNPLVNSVMRYNLGGDVREWVSEASYLNTWLTSSSFAGADDTIKLQAALDAAAGSALIIDESYQISGVNVSSDTAIFFMPDVIISADAGQVADSGLFNFHDIESVTIYGNGATVDGLSILPTANDRHGLDIAGSVDIVVRDLMVIRHSGDGMHVGPTRTAGLAFSNSITISNLVAQQNNGNGLRIQSTQFLVLQSGRFGANGVLAAAAIGNAGIAIVPGGATDELEGIVLNDVSTNSQTIGAGVYVDLTPWNNLGKAPGITVSRHTSVLADLIGFRYLGANAQALPAQGFVRYVDGHLIDCRNQAISVEGADYRGAATEIVRPEITNPNSFLGGAVENRCGIFFGALVGGGGSTSVGKCAIDGPSITDGANPAATDNLICIRNLAVATQVRDMLILNPRRLDWLNDVSKLDRLRVVMDTESSSAIVDPDRVLLYTATGDEVIGRTDGQAIYSNAGLGARRIYTLDNSFDAGSPDIRFELNENQPLRIQAQAGGYIHPGGGDGQYIEARRSGAKLTLRPEGGNVFEVVEEVGKWGFEAEVSNLAALAITGVTTEETLYSRTFNGNALEPGDEVHIIVAGTIEDGTGVKTFRSRINGTEVQSDTSNAGDTESWEVEMHMLVLTSTTAVVRSLTFMRSDRQRHNVVVETIDITTPTTLLVSVQNASASAEVTMRKATSDLEHHPVP